MAHDFFKHAPRIIEEEKYFPVSRLDILRLWFGEGLAEFEIEHELIDPSEEIVEQVPLTLKICGPLKYWIGWDIALLMHNLRIDGYGWERGPYRCLEDTQGYGWHRHIWVPKRGDAKGKQMVDIFEGVIDPENFLIRAFKQMRITLKKDDNAGLF